MEFKDNIDPISTCEFWYDVFDGGYIEPEDLLKNKEDIDKVRNAITLLNQFRDELEENEIIEKI